MLIKERQIPYIAHKIIIDMLHSNFVIFHHGLDKAKKVVEEILEEDVAREREIENEVRALIEEKREENEILFYSIDEKELFSMLKKKLADEDEFTLNRVERLNNLAYKIINELWDRELIDYEISDGKMKNIVFNSINNFIQAKKEVEEVVYEKLKNYKKLIPGSEEWEIVFNKLYEQELKKRGLL